MNFSHLSLVRLLTPEAPWSAEKESKFPELYRLLIETNERINLTSITSSLDVALRHFADSLSLFQCPAFQSAFSGAKGICDVGCGGGFPGLPLAVLSPEKRILMIDSTEKKIRALEKNAALLGLDSVKAVWGRGEEMTRPGGDFRETQEIAVSRAVARLNVLTELCLPFLKVGGVFFALKGVQAPREWEEASGAIRALGGKAEELYRVKWPEIDLSSCSSDDRARIEEFLGQERYIAVIRKVSRLKNEFPRKWAQMTKNPL